MFERSSNFLASLGSGYFPQWEPVSKYPYPASFCLNAPEHLSQGGISQSPFLWMYQGTPGPYSPTQQIWTSRRCLDITTVITRLWEEPGRDTFPALSYLIPTAFVIKGRLCPYLLHSGSERLNSSPETRGHVATAHLPKGRGREWLLPSISTVQKETSPHLVGFRTLVTEVTDVCIASPGPY